MATAKKKKKQLRLLALVGIIAVLAVIYLLIRGGDETGDLQGDAITATDDAVITICPLAESDLVKVAYENPDFAATIVLQEDGSYILEENPDFPLNQTKAGYSFKYLDTAADRLVSENADLAEFGLDHPTVKIFAADANGNEYRLLIGNRIGTASETGYYACTEGSTTVYLVPATLYTHYMYNEQELILIEEIPAIESSAINVIEVVSEEFGDFTATNSTELSEGTTGMAMTNWIISAPYDTDLEGDDESIAGMLPNYTAITFSSPVDYREENLASYGLNPAVTTVSLTYTAGTTEEEYTLCIGNQSVDGSYYVCNEGSSLVYLMESYLVEKLADIDVESMVSPYVNLVYIRTITDMQVVSGGTKHSYEMLHDITYAEDGTESFNDTDFIVDGVEVSDDSTSFTELYQKIIGMKGNGILPDDTVAEGEARLSFEYNRTSDAYKPLLVEYVPYDDNNDAVRINGVPVYTIDRRDVTALIEAVNAYVPD